MSAYESVEEADDTVAGVAQCCCNADTCASNTCVTTDVRAEHGKAAVCCWSVILRGRDPIDGKILGF